MQPIFRVATLADRPALSTLRFELWPHCPLEQHAFELAQRLLSAGVVVLAQLDGQLVGFAEVSMRVDYVEGARSAPVPYLEGWYVREAQRGQGLGRGMLALVEQWALAGGYSELASDAEIENHQSIRLHQQIGFVEVSRSVHFLKKLESKNA